MLEYLKWIAPGIKKHGLAVISELAIFALALTCVANRWYVAYVAAYILCILFGTSYLAFATRGRR